MAAELGLVGLLGLALLVGGTAVSARDALRRDPEAVAGMCAATLVWFLHASIDWDWQLPAVTLPAVILAGAMISVAAPRAGPAAAAAARARRAVAGSGSRVSV